MPTVTRGDVEKLLHRPNHPDPRTTLLVVLVINICVMARVSLPVVLVIAGIVVTAHLSIHAWRLAGYFAALECLWLFLLIAPAQLYPSGFSAFLTILGYWMLRFTASMGIAGYALKVIAPSEMLSALRRLHLPLAVIVPATVMLRFLPLVLAEYRAVREAIALRGLSQGWRAMAHPLQFLEFILVPLLTSCARTADEMTAAGMVRGLGSKVKPSTIIELRFGLVDALWLATLAALVALLPVLNQLTLPVGGLS